MRLTPRGRALAYLVGLVLALFLAFLLGELADLIVNPTYQEEL